MARNRKLTDRALKALGKRNLPSAGKTRDVDDGVVPGLKARVMPSGEISFVLVARYPGSRNPTRRSLGLYGELTLNEAREKARRWREQLRNAWGGKMPMEAFENVTRQNMQLFENALRMWSPFTPGAAGPMPAARPAKSETGEAGDSALSDMKKQLELMQRQLDQLTKDKP